MSKTSTATIAPAVSAPVAQTDAYDVLTGHNDLKDAADLNDFLWSMEDEPHATRRKEILKSHPEVKELFGHEPLTKYLVTLLAAFHVACAVYLKDEMFSFKFWAMAYLIGAPCAQALFLALHEVSHNLAFKKFSHNRLFGILANPPLLVPFFMFFKYYHNDHHKYQGVDGIDTDLPTELEAKLLSSFFGKLFFLSFQLLFYVFRPVMVKNPVFTRWHALGYFINGSFIGLMIYFFGPGPIVYLLMSAFLAGSLHPVASHFIAEHYVFKEKYETYSYYGPMNAITWNVGYHNEHHDFPLVAWSRLPSVYRLLKKDYYGKLPHHNNWTKVMIEFITSDHISLFNRVKRKQGDNFRDDGVVDVDFDKAKAE